LCKASSCQNGKLTLPDDDNDLISLIHVVDYDRAVVTSIENDKGHSIYNIVDNEPVSYKHLFSYLAVQLNVDGPTVGSPKFLPSLGCSNKKAKHELLWHPTYPSYLSGLAG
jgi:nucleoside-diphosphate-sugar epimerase